MIKFKTQRVIEVQDWDDLVQKTYGRPYAFQQQDGCKDRGVERITVPTTWTNDYEEDTIPEVVNGDEMGVSFKAWLARVPKQELDSKDDWERKNGINLFWERNFYPDVSMIANDLHEKGLIEAGEYTINIDW